MKFCKFDQDYKTLDRWCELCDDESYRVTEPINLSSLLPEDLLKKTNIVLVMRKEISGSTIFVADLNRIDINAGGSQIDQHPYVVAFDHSGSIARGGFADHGNWVNRTTNYIDPDLWIKVSGSSILNYLPIAELPENTSGKITELKVTSQTEAFGTAFMLLIKADKKTDN